MNCILSSSTSQITPGIVCYPERLPGFLNVKSELNEDDGQLFYDIFGTQTLTESDWTCPDCSVKMHRHGSKERILLHESKGEAWCRLHVTVIRFKCPHCGRTHLQRLPYEVNGHRITTSLEQQVLKLLKANNTSHKMIAAQTGLNAHAIKEIDKKRLIDLYTEGGSCLIRPDHYVKRLGIDEFKLHNGHQYATHIIDLDTGYILWIAFGKRKQIVFDFISHVGMDWMEHVEAVACDMNAGFVSAFLDKCPWIIIAYDHFHIIKNFNDKVVAMVRKDEQRRLQEEGLQEEARKLKRSRYVLLSSRASLAKKDKEGEQGKILKNGSVLFNREPLVAKSGHLKRYEKLLKENKLFFTLDVVKEQLDEAFRTRDEDKMAECLRSIIETCKGTKNIHFEWFASLIEKHWDWIISHSVLGLSNGKIEGINNRIKTVRRMGYGYPDDEYFFLKLMDMSRNRPTQTLH